MNPDPDAHPVAGAARTYSLAEVAAAYLPENWTDGPRWLARRLNRGEIDGYRVGRVWRMTEDDVAAFVARRRNPPKTTTAVAVPEPAPAPISIIDGLSARSRHGLVRSS